MGKKSSPPAPPDYNSLIPQQEASNMRQFNTLLNASRVNSTTPFGSTTWSRPEGPDGTWTVNQQLDPQQQQLYNQDMGLRQQQGNVAGQLLNNVSGTYSQPANFASLLPEYGSNDPGRMRIEDAMYNSKMRFLEPALQQQENRMSDRLVAQGFNVKDAAYNDAMKNVYQQSNLQRQQAGDLAVGAGQDESKFQLAQAMQRIGLAQGDRARPLNELASLRTGQQINIPGLSGSAPTPNLNNVDLLSTANQNYLAQLGGYNAGQAQSGNFLSGLMGLFGGLGSAAISKWG